MGHEVRCELMPHRSCPMPVGLPARLGDPGDVSAERELAEADAAELKLPQNAARPAAHFAPVHFPRHELRLPLSLDDHRCFGHLFLLVPLSRTACSGTPAAERL